MLVTARRILITFKFQIFRNSLSFFADNCTKFTVLFDKKHFLLNDMKLNT